MSSRRLVSRRATALLVGAVCLLPAAGWAITLNQVDTFNNETTQGWGVNRFANPITPVGIELDGGSSGVAGDHALLMDSNEYGIGRLVIINESQWTGNWTAAGVTRITMDVKNPNAFTLSMRLGISGPNPPSSGGSGTNFVTKVAVPVPADNAWHSISFDVSAADFAFVNIGSENIAAALASVAHFRILHDRWPGDYNANLVVDAADYVVWRDTISTTVPTGTGADGSGPMSVPDGAIDGYDYDFWRSQYGSANVSFVPLYFIPGKFLLDNIRAVGGAAAGAGVAQVAEIPEPASLLLMSVAFIYGWLAARHRV
jgi:hypothetical protein